MMRSLAVKVTERVFKSVPATESLSCASKCKSASYFRILMKSCSKYNGSRYATPLRAAQINLPLPNASVIIALAHEF